MELFQFSPSSLRWQDILDITINSYILFRLYVLLRGTTVKRVMVVIGGLWLFNRVAIDVGLIVTSWAVQTIIAVAALVVIIVFRNEIAGVFQTRSLKSFFWGIPQNREKPCLEIIAESVFEMAERKIGALIVFPMHKPIEDLLDGGIPWEGKLSKEMLHSIFLHESPVHDGAIYVENDRIRQVSVILPLSANKEMPSKFGTRHRAALGLSERSDALILVVSEERGEVTVFREGCAYDMREYSELIEFLQKCLVINKPGTEQRKQLIELSIAGFFCITIITTIWFSFARGLETLGTYDVPIEFSDHPQGMKIFSASVGSAKLQISGSRSLLKTITPEEIGVKISLANAVAGKNEMTINRDGIVLPPGIELKQVIPQIVEVNIDKPATKKLPVQISWSGKLSSGLIMKSGIVGPGFVEVEGSDQMLETIRAIYTEPISLAAIKESGETSVGLMLLSSSLKLTDASSKNVKVSYQVGIRKAE